MRCRVPYLRYYYSIFHAALHFIYSICQLFSCGRRQSSIDMVVFSCSYESVVGGGASATGTSHAYAYACGLAMGMDKHSSIEYIYMFYVWTGF